MKPASVVVAILLDLIGLLHVLRLAFHTEVTVGGWVVPMWVSMVGCVVPVVLSVLVLREARTAQP